MYYTLVNINFIEHIIEEFVAINEVKVLSSNVASVNKLQSFINRIRV